MPIEASIKLVSNPLRTLVDIVKLLSHLFATNSLLVAFRIMAGIFDAILRGLGGDPRVQNKLQSESQVSLKSAAILLAPITS